MALIKSISGIRGTIGDNEGEFLSPVEIAKFASAFGTYILNKTGKSHPLVILGRDARMSGMMLNSIIAGALTGCGINVRDIGMATTPTVEMAVILEKADGGVIITASHNPAHWNALKLLNEKGEFLSKSDGESVLKIAEISSYRFAGVESLGHIEVLTGYERIHIEKVLALPEVDIEAIKKASFRVAIDTVNSVGGNCLPELLYRLGVKEVIGINTVPDGRFAHNPEPLPENLIQLSEAIRNNNADLGFAVDPDVDRLAIINEDGSMFGEEYTLVSVADYILKQKPGNTVSNMSSTRALREVTESYGMRHFSSAVGEVNVVEEMKKQNAVIGGEGNGGVIYPALHYGRDALAGIALFLSHLAKSGIKCSELRKRYPVYYISKNKIQLGPGIDPEKIFDFIKKKYSHLHPNDIDGIKIDFENEWVQLRKSNTEPIIRIYSEGKSREDADKLAIQFIEEIENFV